MAAATEIEAGKVETPKGVQGFVKARLAQVQTQLDGLGDKVKIPFADLKKSLGKGPQQTIHRIREALQLDRLKGLLKKAPVARVEQAVSDGVKLTEDAVQKLGLAKVADVSALKEAFETMQKRIDQLKTRVDGLVRATTPPKAKSHAKKKATADQE